MTGTVKAVRMADTIHDNVNHLEHFNGSAVAGYVTGSSDIAWTLDDFNRFGNKHTVRINQRNDIEHYGLGHVLDLENRAWTIPNAVEATRRRHADKRHTTIYVNVSNHAELVAKLKAEKLQALIWLADWNLTEDEAVKLLGTGSADFPIVAVQWASPSSNPGTMLPGTSMTLHQANADLSVVSAPWLALLAGGGPPDPKPGPKVALGLLITDGPLRARKVESKDHGKTWEIAA